MFQDYLENVNCPYSAQLTIHNYSQPATNSSGAAVLVHIVHPCEGVPLDVRAWKTPCRRWETIMQVLHFLRHLQSGRVYFEPPPPFV